MKTEQENNRSVKHKKIDIKFKYKGETISFTMFPEEDDWWTSDGRFDYHYSEDYRKVSVYLIPTNDSDFAETCVFSKKI